MNLEELMLARNGEWVDGHAVVLDSGGYYVRVARGTATHYELTKDAAQFGVTQDVANTSASVLESAHKPRGRKPKGSPNDLDLDL